MTKSHHPSDTKRPKERPKRRLSKLVIVSLIVFTSFGLGMVATAMVVVPVAAVGLSFGLIGAGAFGAVQTMTALQAGNSEQRMAALTQLRTMLDVPAVSHSGPEFFDAIRPGVESCTTDSAPDVVALANEVLSMLNEIDTPK